jgi:hypothetical protein
MRPVSFHSETLVRLLRRQKIATMAEMKAALGTAVDMTVFRKLREIPYHASYSHRGRYYALDGIARFDERGLWTYRAAHFSRLGSLIDTVEHFVARADRGLLAAELAEELEVQVKEPLLTLVRAGRIAREEMAGRYVYCSAESAKRRQQIRLHQEQISEASAAPLADLPARSSPETRAAVILFFSLLDERQRRLYAGLESMRLGHGGDRQIARRMGMDVHTIARGRRELLERDLELDRVRRPGGGRERVEKKRPR